MEDIFINKIKINKVRHLENIEIPLSETERKHLILTGKNGSGKTSVLEALRDFLKFFLTKEEVPNSEKYLFERLFEGGYTENSSSIKEFNGIEVQINNAYLLKHGSLYDDTFNNFVLAYFNAKRTSEFNIPKGIAKFETKNTYSIEEEGYKNFLQHIVNLKAESSFARDEGEEEIVHEIEDWFKNFEQSLKEIFEDDSLELKFNRKSFDYNIISTKEKKEFTFHTLSEGYSALLNIVTELIMRMSEKGLQKHDIQGIVLIDEVDVHLHVALQKKILPFLTRFFPKIQFIVTTHSPFVINSIDNAVVYDLERQFLVEEEHMEGISYEGIIESYFDSNKYSYIVLEKVQEYESLTAKEELTEEEKEKLLDLKMYFKEIPKLFSPELNSKIRSIQLSTLGRDKSA